MIKKVLGNRGFWVFAMFVIMGIAMTCSAAKDKAAMEKGVTDFNEMTEFDFISGRFVEGTVYTLVDEFAYEEEYQRTLGIKHGERVSAHYYILPLSATADYDVPQFAALCIGNTQLAGQAEQMVNEYWDYMMNDTEPNEWTEIYITGKISKLDGELLDFFYDWFYQIDEDITREDIDSMLCPYIINYQVPDASSNMIGTGIVIMVIGILGCVFMFVYYAKKETASQADIPGSFSGGLSGGTSASETASGYNTVNTGNGTFTAADNSQNGGMSYTPTMAGMSEISGIPAGGTASQQDTQSQTTGGYGDMDSIDTSSLGIGIGDDDR